jgi:uncharacterized protein (DUF1778 family)
VYNICITIFEVLSVKKEKTKQVAIFISKEDLNLIDKGSELDKRSRSSFLIISGVERARDVIKQMKQNE